MPGQQTNRPRKLLPRQEMPLPGPRLLAGALQVEDAKIEGGHAVAGGHLDNSLVRGLRPLQIAEQVITGAQVEPCLVAPRGQEQRPFVKPRRLLQGSAVGAAGFPRAGIVDAAEVDEGVNIVGMFDQHCQTPRPGAHRRNRVIRCAAIR